MTEETQLEKDLRKSIELAQAKRITVDVKAIAQVAAPVRVAMLPAQPPVSVTGPAGGQVRAVQAGLASGQLPGAVPVQPKLVAAPVVAKPGLAATVKAAVAPAGMGGMVPATTDTVLSDSYFRAVLYGPTGERKTSTAAEFEDPEYVRIVLTRDPSQLIPLAGLNYRYVHADTAAKFEFAMTKPEQLWPEWGRMADPEKRRTIICDDLTKAIDLMVKAAAVKDNRMAYRDAKNDLDEIVTGLCRKPYNIILIALAKVGESIKDDEMIVPEMSPSLYRYVCSEFSAVLYIDAKKDKILTSTDSFGIATENADGKVTGTKTRSIFSKHKLPKMLVGKGLIAQYEPRDLRAFWKKLKAAQLTAVKTGGVK